MAAETELYDFNIDKWLKLSLWCVLWCYIRDFPKLDHLFAFEGLCNSNNWVFLGVSRTKLHARAIYLAQEVKADNSEGLRSLGLTGQFSQATNQSKAYGIYH